MKPVQSSAIRWRNIRGFPEDARHDAGYQLELVQRGEQPDDFKPMPDIGEGVEEIRVRESSGIYRVIYTARLAEAVYVLHAFQKKSKRGIATPRSDIELIRRRLRDAESHHLGSLKEKRS